ncbi:hypothetical protein LS68_002710 [Helicobacter sp. MIT 05-5293]|uniref:CiaD-like domain-containing protein n=1 Tax=Helicobacter sp. MIT 05-5293 TaxID=1548149 RepID=UPI00051D6444|nr:hypothetical protein [Helicobacter sp. MIT 05-5293]TLD81943.1 hypothetical protein LS68_002710 [Helicobacter sp. MIT 05-5293]
MEIKDLILETLNELANPNDNIPTQIQSDDSEIRQVHTSSLQNPKIPDLNSHHNKTPNDFSISPAQPYYATNEECEFLESLQERLLVLFEGLNAPQNKDIQSQLTITINFLEYQLIVLQERINDLKK